MAAFEESCRHRGHVGSSECDPMQTFNDQDVVTLETATARFAQPRTRRSGALNLP